MTNVTWWYTVITHISKALFIISQETNPNLKNDTTRDVRACLEFLLTCFLSPGDRQMNVVMWMDHRAAEQAARITKTGHKVLSRVGGVMSPEMQPPKLLWLKEVRWAFYCWSACGGCSFSLAYPFLVEQIAQNMFKFFQRCLQLWSVTLCSSDSLTRPPAPHFNLVFVRISEKAAGTKLLISLTCQTSCLGKQQALWQGELGWFITSVVDYSNSYLWDICSYLLRMCNMKE